MELKDIITTAGPWVVAVIGAFFGKQALDAKGATIALLECTIKAKEDEKAATVAALERDKAAEVTALQAQVKALEREVDVFGTKNAAEAIKATHERAKSEWDAKEREVQQLKVEVVQARADGQEAVAQAKEEALRQAQVEECELESTLVDLTAELSVAVAHLCHVAEAAQSLATLARETLDFLGHRGAAPLDSDAPPERGSDKAPLQGATV